MMARIFFLVCLTMMAFADTVAAEGTPPPTVEEIYDRHMDSQSDQAVSSAAKLLLTRKDEYDTVFDIAVERVVTKCAALDVFPETEEAFQAALLEPVNLSIKYYALIMGQIALEEPKFIARLAPIFKTESHCVSMAALMVADLLKMNARPYRADMERIFAMKTLPDYAGEFYRSIAGKTISQIIAADIMMESMTTTRSGEVSDAEIEQLFLEVGSLDSRAARKAVRTLRKINKRPEYLIDGSIAEVQKRCVHLIPLPATEEEMNAIDKKYNLKSVYKYAELADEMIRKNPQYISKMEPLLRSDEPCIIMGAVSILFGLHDKKDLVSAYVDDVVRFMKMDGLPSYMDGQFVKMGKKLLQKVDTDASRAALASFEAAQ